MKECTFCKIINGEINAAKIWEDGHFLAILDVNPNTKEMTLVIQKKHYPSYAFDLGDEVYKKLMIASKKVALLLDKKLNVKRTAMVMEGMGINHTHIKLYPLYGLDSKFKETWTDNKVFFEKYEGYITTQLGQKMDLNKLKRLADKIRD